MDLITNNNNNNNIDRSLKAELEHRQAASTPRKSGKGQEGKKKSEKFVNGKETKKREIPNQGKNKPSKNPFHSPILLASNSKAAVAETRNDGDGVVTGASQEPSFSTGWRMQETGFSCFRQRTTGEGGNIRFDAGSTGNAIRAVDNKIDSGDAIVVGKKGGFGREEQEDSSPRTTTEVASFLYHRLARVDPIVDFFAVDEELLGRFRICSCLSRQIKRRNDANSSTYDGGGGGSGGEGGIQQQQQAIIFKIKTTSPYSFWVRPIYGLMRPNVMAWVEVKCELKANSLAKFEQNMDEFLVEICPVPGAIHSMTNDLYTNCIHTNVPELVSIWERVDQELKDNQLQFQGFVKEFHRVSCRFQRSSLSLSSSMQSFIQSATSSQLPVLLQPEKHVTEDKTMETIFVGDEALYNNNYVKNYQWESFHSTEAKKTTSRECYHLAREFPRFLQNNSDEGNSAGAHSSSRPPEEQCSDRGSGGEKTNRCCSCCSSSRAVRKVCCLSFILALLLFAALGFIFYTQFYQYYFYDKKSSNNAVKNLFQRQSYIDDKNVLPSKDNKSYNKRYFHR